jgi:hypothetical protein
MFVNRPATETSYSIYEGESTKRGLNYLIKAGIE